MSDFTVVSDTNPIYAEIERLKRERDTLAEALKIAHSALLHANRNGWTQKNNIWGPINAALAQVRK